MKKIIIINHYGVTPDLPGATKHYDMAKYFSEKGTHKIEFWMCGYNHKMGTNHPHLRGFKFQAIEKSENIDIVRVKSSPYRRSLILRQLNVIIFDIITAFKILFSWDIEGIVLNVPPISIFNVLAIRMKKIKLITDVEDLWPLFLVEMGMKNKIVIKYMEICSNYTYRVSNKIATVSRGMLEYVQERVKDSKELWISPLGVSTEEYFDKEKNFALLKDKEWTTDFKIMYLGAHGKANDINSVLNTIKRLNDKIYNTINGKKISFIFIGDGEQKDNIIKYSQELGLNNVYFEDAVPGNLVPDYLVHADICLTNLKKIESFKRVRPNKLFQYMALEKPIISGIWGEFQTIIEEVGAGIYVDFTNSEKASKAIYDLINDDARLQKMSLNGKKYIEQYGDRKKIFEEFYTKIIEVIDNDNENEKRGK